MYRYASRWALFVHTLTVVARRCRADVCPRPCRRRRLACDCDHLCRRCVACDCHHRNRSGLRLGLPFSNQAAKETRQKRPYTAHIVAGDFNASATELRNLGAEGYGWEMVFGNLRTSSGGKAYDNFLINRDAKDHLMLSSHIYDLTRFANFAKGEQGISDHAPIVLSLHEQPPRM